MPVIEINRKEFEKLAGKQSDKDLKENIPMMGTDLESVDKNIIKVEIFPNRPDLLSDQGFARAYSSFVGKQKGIKKYDVKKSNYSVIIDKSVSKVRPYTACAVVKNLKLDETKIEEIITIQEKLHITFGRNRKKAAIGIYPLEKIQMPIMYLAKKPKDIRFVPLDEKKEMNANEILLNHEKGKEFADLLIGKDVYPIFVDDNNQVLSMPPVINSETVGKIDEKTKDVFIECSGFDFEYLKKCLNMIVTALADMGGDIYSMTLKYPDGNHVTPNLSPEKMKLDVDYVNKRLGTKFSEKEIKKSLQKMGLDFEKGNALIPAWRSDILHPIDLVEDIAIGYGYNNFKPKLTQGFTVGKENKIEIFKKSIQEMLTGLTFNEVSTYCLTSKEKQLDMMNFEYPLVELKNSLSSEWNVLRFWMIPSMMEVLNFNKMKEYPQKFFGFGRIFKHDSKKETGVSEAERLGCVIAGQGADYTRIRQVIDYIFRMLGVDYDVSETEHPSFIPGRVARISVNKKGIGFVGEIHPAVLQNWDLEVPVAAFELNISDLLDEI